MVKLTSKQLKAANMIYFAWDLPEINDKAVKVLEATTGLLQYIKINSAFDMGGPELINKLRNMYNMNVFLDLKLYDIPATVERRAFAQASLGIEALTVHSHGGVPMMEAAVQGVSKAVDKFGVEMPNIYGVSVLTSFNELNYIKTVKKVVPELKTASIENLSEQEFYGILESMGLKNVIKDQVLNLGGLAEEAGIDGIVCSPKEVKMIKKEYPKLMAVTPGIQGVTGIVGESHNLERVAIPSNAIKWGADKLVVGSAIHAAEDPRQAMFDIIYNIEGVI